MLLAVAKQPLALVEELLGPDHLLGQGEPDPIHQLHQLLVVDHHAATEGDTPRLRQLADMGVEEAMTGAHRYRGLRSVAFGRTLELPWPDVPGFPNYGYTITRHDLDALVASPPPAVGTY